MNFPRNYWPSGKCPTKQHIADFLILRFRLLLFNTIFISFNATVHHLLKVNKLIHQKIKHIIAYSFFKDIIILLALHSNPYHLSDMNIMLQSFSNRVLGSLQVPQKSQETKIKKASKGILSYLTSTGQPPLDNFSEANKKCIHNIFIPVKIDCKFQPSLINDVFGKRVKTATTICHLSSGGLSCLVKDSFINVFIISLTF